MGSMLLELERVWSFGAQMRRQMRHRQLVIEALRRFRVSVQYLLRVPCRSWLALYRLRPLDLGHDYSHPLQYR